MKSWDGLGDNGNFGDLIYRHPYFRMNKIDDNINQADGGEERIVENCLFERVKKEGKEQKEGKVRNEKNSSIFYCRSLSKSMNATMVLFMRLC